MVKIILENVIDQSATENMQVWKAPRKPHWLWESLIKMGLGANNELK